MSSASSSGSGRLQRAQAGRLDRRAIGHRIGEGHAELDDVGAGARKPFMIASVVA
jgi:hypothetical protein